MSVDHDDDGASAGASDHGGENEITRCLYKTWCHQCKMRKPRVIACDNFFSKDKDVRCNGRYCDACASRHYLEEASSLEDLQSWFCYRCTGRCTCAACKRRRKAEEDGVPEIDLDPEPRRRETRRYSDEELYNDDEFSPSSSHKRQARRASPSPDLSPPNNANPAPPTLVAATAAVSPGRPTLEPRFQNMGGMSALALLAEESLTSEFVPRHDINAEAVELMSQHSNEIARLKQMCLLLQLQVAKLSKHIDI